jgi:flagellar hook-length control protein FliK
LANATPGEHTLTINVAPDNLGPVTVRAHVTGEGLRVELFAPTDMARDALRAILPDLRRDLSGQGMHANLDLSSQNQPRDGSAASPEERSGRNPEHASHPRIAEAPAHEHSGNVPENNVRTGLFGPASTIDVMV